MASSTAATFAPSSIPARSFSLRMGMVVMVSRLTTHSRGKPSRAPRTTSTGIPRTRVVTGAIVTRAQASDPPPHFLRGSPGKRTAAAWAGLGAPPTGLRTSRARPGNASRGGSGAGGPDRRIAPPLPDITPFGRVGFPRDGRPLRDRTGLESCPGGVLWDPHRPSPRSGRRRDDPLTGGSRGASTSRRRGSRSTSRASVRCSGSRSEFRSHISAWFSPPRRTAGDTR